MQAVNAVELTEKEEAEVIDSIMGAESLSASLSRGLEDYDFGACSRIEVIKSSVVATLTKRAFRAIMADIGEKWTMSEWLLEIIVTSTSHDHIKNHLDMHKDMLSDIISESISEHLGKAIRQGMAEEREWR